MPGTPGRRAGTDQRRWGWARAAFFDRVGAEHRAVRERVGLFDFTSFGKLDVSGPGALALLQRLADNDVDRPVGSVIYTQFLNPRGGIESDLTVTRWAPDRFRVTTGSNFVASDLGWILMHLPSDDSVQVRDVTDAFACIGLWGPDARRVLQAVTASDVSNAALPYMSARPIEIAGAAVGAQRVTYVGELGWELYVDEPPCRRGLGRAARGRPALRHRARRVQGRRLAAAREGLPLLEQRSHAGREPLRSRARLLRAPAEGRLRRPRGAEPDQGRGTHAEALHDHADGGDARAFGPLRWRGRVRRRPCRGTAAERGLGLHGRRSTSASCIYRRRSRRPARRSRWKPSARASPPRSRRTCSTIPRAPGFACSAHRHDLVRTLPALGPRSDGRRRLDPGMVRSRCFAPQPPSSLLASLSLAAMPALRRRRTTPTASEWWVQAVAEDAPERSFISFPTTRSSLETGWGSRATPRSSSATRSSAPRILYVAPGERLELVTPQRTRCQLREMVGERSKSPLG